VTSLRGTYVQKPAGYYFILLSILPSCTTLTPVSFIGTVRYKVQRGTYVQKTQTRSPSNDDELIRFAAAAAAAAATAAAAAATVAAPLLFLLLQFSTGALSVAVREPIPNASAANDGIVKAFDAFGEVVLSSLPSHTASSSSLTST
jgi:hypothetical protein